MIIYIRFFGVLLLACLLLLGGGLVWLGIRDPYAALPQPRDVRLVGSRTVQKENRTLSYLTFTDPEVGETTAILSLPRPNPQTPRPLMVVLGGLPKAEDNMRHTPDPGPNAALFYDWPFDPFVHKRGEPLMPRLPHIYRSSSRMPGQITAITLWARQQPEIDADRISLLGFSLGALSVPAAQRMLQNRNVPIRATLLAYGGTPISDLLARHPAFRNMPLKPVFQQAAHLFTRHLDPGAHLPYLQGRFLVINGAHDELVPAPAARRLAELTPEPKTVLTLTGPHMGVQPKKRGLLRQIEQTTWQWLLRQDAILPRPAARQTAS